ncbi:hypothetical protein AHiyo8_43720 [Arthrobacter sp. Hiyo8]|nr:hypothetical protein AHiyo8_43720 [Arthrobacter sp. Hiyo8]
MLGTVMMCLLIYDLIERLLLTPDDFLCGG